MARAEMTREAAPEAAMPVVVEVATGKGIPPLGAWLMSA